MTRKPINTPGALPPGVVPDAPSAPAPARRGMVERRDIQLWKEAQTAPLDELMLAYTTITARLADLVDEQKESN